MILIVGGLVANQAVVRADDIGVGMAVMRAIAGEISTTARQYVSRSLSGL